MLVNVLVFLVTFVVLAAVLTTDLLRHLNAQVDSELARLSDSALEHVELESGRPRLTEREEQSSAGSGERAPSLLLDAQGNVSDGVGAMRSAEVAMLPPPQRGRTVAFTLRGADSSQPLRVYTRPLRAASDEYAGEDANLGYIQIGIVPTEIVAMLAQIRRSLLLATPLALLGAGLAAPLLAARPCATSPYRNDSQRIGG